MASKVFVDANVLLDFILKRTGFDEAKSIIQKGIERQIHLYTTPAVIHITSNWVAKAHSPKKAREIILSLLAEVTVIDCTHGTALMALNSKIADVEDALQYYTALEHKIDYFVSGDKKLKADAIPNLPVYTAAQLLAELD